jgi:hypothetical protein
MNAIQISQKQDFIAIAMTEAFDLVSEKTGISVEALREQFPENKALQKSIAQIVANAAIDLSKMIEV